MASEWRETPYGLMSSKLSFGRLSDLTVPNVGVQTGPFGSQLHQEDYVPEGTPIITVEHMGENRILHENLPRVSDADKNRLNKYHLQAGDIVFSRVGSVDRRALVRDAENGWLFSGRCLRVRADPDILDATYLSYFFGLEGFKKYIRGVAVGATMPSINTQILSELPIYYPPLPIQRQIASILSAFDDKIELNRQMNRTLEQMARALFKSWFVDFDPVRAKMRGEQPEGMDAATATLFPSELVEVDGREVPKGWEWGAVGKVMTNPRRAVNPNNVSPSTPYVGLEHMPRGSIQLSEWGFAEDVTSGKVAFEAGEILFGKLRPYFKKVGIAPISGLASTDILIINPKIDWAAFVLFLVSGDEYIEAMSNASGGTRMPRASWADLEKYEFTIPSLEIAKKFNEATQSMVEKIISSTFESARLTSLRDALLPRLLSGEVDVSEWGGNT